jgi:hypothetical protein
MEFFKKNITNYDNKNKPAIYNSYIYI